MGNYFRLYENIDRIDPSELKRVAGLKDPDKVTWPKGKKFKVQLAGEECTITTSFARAADKAEGDYDAYTALSTMMTRDEVVERIHKEDPNGHSDADVYAHAEFLPGLPKLTDEEKKHREAFMAAILTLLSDQETIEVLAQRAPRKKNGLFHKGRVFKIGLTGFASRYDSQLLEIVGKSKDEKSMTISVTERNTSPDELKDWNQDFISTYHAGLPISEALKEVYKDIDPNMVFEAVPEKKVTPEVKNAEPAKKNKVTAPDQKIIVESGDFDIEGNTLKKYTGKDEEVVIPDGIKTIDKFAFYGSSIKKISMPDSVTSIKDAAFSNCHNLEEVIFSKKLTSMGRETFISAASLKSVDLSNTKVKSIRMKCFMFCDNLENIQFPDTLKSIEDEAFTRTIITEYRFPASIEKISPKAFGSWNDIISDIYFAGTNAVTDFNPFILIQKDNNGRLHCIKGSELWNEFVSLREEREEWNKKVDYNPALMRRFPELIEL